MSKVTRLLILLAVLLILGAAGAFALYSFFSRERILAWVTPPLESFLQRQVRINDASLTLRGLRLLGLEVRDKGAPTPVLTSERVDLHWKLMALMKARLELGALVFDKPVLMVTREKDGKFNVGDLLARSMSQEKAADQTSGASRTLPLAPGTVSLTDGRITVIDRALSPEKTTTLTKVSSKISGCAGLEPISFQGEGQIDTGTAGSFQVEGTFDPERRTLTTKLELHGLDLDGLGPYLTFKSTSLDKGRMDLSATLESEGFDRLSTRGSIQLADLRVKIGDERLPSMNWEAAFEVNGTRSQQLLEISNLQLVINGQRCSARGRLSHWRERPYVEFTLSSASLKLDQLLELLPDLEPSAVAPETPSFPSGTGTDASSQKLPTATRLDRLKGLLPGMGPAPQAVKGATNQQPGPVREPVWNWAAAIPFLMQVDAVGNLELEWLYYKTFVANKASCQVRLQSGSFQVEPLRVSLWGGQLDGALQGKFNVAGYPIQARCSLKNIMVDELTRALMPGNAGRWSGNLTLASTASGLCQDMRSIKSRSDVLITEADITDHPVIDKVADFFGAAELKRLQFSQMSVGIATNRGLISVADLYMEGPALRMEGGGSVDARHGAMDLRLILRLPVQYAGKITALGPYLSKITDQEDFTRVPLQLSGTLEKPEFRVDEQWLKQRYREPAPKKVPEPEPQPEPEPRQLPLSDSDKTQLQQGLEKLVQ
ncbi:MAG TPA: DUF748 domain-containing protein [Syntrophobacteria bacterium]|nr:DUF748 domain-containing protein [Syntrophobacteria bacterium]